MQSKAKDVTAYIQEATPERQVYLAKLRELCLEVMIGYDEVMAYGMPGYQLHGTIEVGFANQKHYIALYILKDVVRANRDLPVRTSGLRLRRSATRAHVDRQVEYRGLGRPNAHR